MVRYWEDYNIGDKYQTPGRTVTETIVNTCSGLVGLTDHFIWDEEEAKSTLFGARACPGVITVAIAEALGTVMIDQESNVALLGLQARFKTPVLFGDTIRAEMEVTDKRPTKNPERGILIFKTVIRNQHGAEVLEEEETMMVKRRPA